MSGLVVDSERCIGCGRCVRACGCTGIVVEGPRGRRLARPTDACILCASCVDACPVDAISIEREEAGAADLASYSGYWVLCQTVLRCRWRSSSSAARASWRTPAAAG